MSRCWVGWVLHDVHRGEHCFIYLFAVCGWINKIKRIPKQWQTAIVLPVHYLVLSAFRSSHFINCFLLATSNRITNTSTSARCSIETPYHQSPYWCEKWMGIIQMQVCEKSGRVHLSRNGKQFPIQRSAERTKRYIMDYLEHFCSHKNVEKNSKRTDGSIWIWNEIYFPISMRGAIKRALQMHLRYIEPMAVAWLVTVGGMKTKWKQKNTENPSQSDTKRKLMSKNIYSFHYPRLMGDAEKALFF